MGSTLSKETEDKLWGRSPSSPNKVQLSPRPLKKAAPTIEDQMWGRDRDPEVPGRSGSRESRRPKNLLTDDDAAIDLKEDSDNPEDWDPQTAGPIFPNGEINWDCPCLGNAAHGPCGTEFRGAFSCFIESKDDPKGADCLVQFREMQLCFTKYPELYARDEEDDDEEDLGDVEIEPPKKGTEKVGTPTPNDDKELDDLVEELFGEEDEEREKQKTQSPRPSKGRGKESQGPVVGSPAPAVL